MSAEARRDAGVTGRVATCVAGGFCLVAFCLSPRATWCNHAGQTRAPCAGRNRRRVHCTRQPPISVHLRANCHPIGSAVNPLHVLK